MTNQQPKVSVIIPAYNAVRTLPITLKAILEQTFPQKDYEVIVIDDCSTDGTTNYLKSTTFPDNVIILHHEKNQKHAITRNTGIRKSRGGILIFLDADMEVYSDYIQKHLTHFQNPEVVGVIGSLLPAPELPYGKYQRYLFEGKRGAMKFNDGAPQPFQVFLFNNTSVRRGSLEKVGLFDENIRFYGGEDAELAFRIWKEFPNGLYFDPTIQAIHHDYRSLDEALKIIEDFGEKVVPYLIRKHPEMARLYGIDFIHKKTLNAGQRRNILKIAVGFIVRRRWFYLLFRWKFAVVPFPLSNAVVRLLMASALLRGMSQAR